MRAATLSYEKKSSDSIIKTDEIQVYSNVDYGYFFCIPLNTKRTC